MEKLKECLRRWPRAYGTIHKSYYGVLYALERSFLGTRINQLRWSRKRDTSIEELMRTVEHPHRTYLVGKIEKWLPFQSVLEVGCHAGANLMLLAKRFPNAVLAGIDINGHYVEVGKKGMARENIGNVSLWVGSAGDLSRFADKSVDVTFTDATLMYVGPDKIMRALCEMVRVTRKALIFNEWAFEGAPGQPASTWYYLHWVHDFRSLFRQVSGVKDISVAKLPGHLWGPDGWQEYGTLVEVALS